MRWEEEGGLTTKRTKSTKSTEGKREMGNYNHEIHGRHEREERLGETIRPTGDVGHFRRGIIRSHEIGGCR